MNTQLKIDHEKASCIRFLALYNSLNKSSLSFVRLGDPNKKEPDCICSNNTAIELVGAYDNQYQAHKIWNEARKRRDNKAPEFRLLTFENLESAISSKLDKLNDKKYAGFEGRIILACNLHSPLLTDVDVETFVSKYNPFKNDNFFDKYFSEVWITWLSEGNDGWHIKRLE